MSDYTSVYLHELYGDFDHDQAAVSDQPLLKMFDIVDGKGRAITYGFKLSGARNAGGGLAQAQLNAGYTTQGSGVDAYEFSLPYGTFEGQIEIKDKDIQMSQGSEAAYTDALSEQIDAGTAVFGQDLAFQLGTDQGKAIGRATYNDTAKTLSFDDKWLAGRVFLGEAIVISANDGTNVSHSLVGQIGIVVNVSPSSGVVTVATTSAPTVAANPGSWVDATSYYVFRAGQFQPGLFSAMLLGVADYLPNSWSTSIGDLHGVVRSKDERTTGTRLTSEEANGKTFSERIEELAGKMQATAGAKQGVKGYCCLFNPRDFTAFSRELNNQFVRTETVRTEAGYEAFKVATVLGIVECVSEPTKAAGTAWLLAKDHLKLHTPNGKLVNFAKAHGNMLRLKDGANTYEARPVAYAATCIGNPAHHGVFPTT